MCEILFKAVDSRQPTVAEWRADRAPKIPVWQQYINDHFDVPIVEANCKRLVAYRDAKIAYKIEPLQKYMDIIAAYEANPLTQAEIEKVVAYYREDPDDTGMLKPNVVGLWKYYKHEVEVEWVKDDAVKAGAFADKDRRGNYKRGDPVVIMPDGHIWGREEGLPKFFIVKIPGLAVETAKKYIAEQMDSTDPEKPVLFRRRRFGLPVDSLPNPVKNAVNNQGIVTVTLAQARQYMIDKVTGLPEP